MKKLEKLGSKLFEEFRGDEVSELASVIGGEVITDTKVRATGCKDQWRSVDKYDLNKPEDRSTPGADQINTVPNSDCPAAYTDGNLSPFEGPLPEIMPDTMLLCSF